VEARFCNRWGLQFNTITTLPASGVVVVGADATIADAQLEAFARGGGKVLFLARQNTQGAAGLQLQEKADFPRLIAGSKLARSARSFCL
jgi:hypothetical protein